MIPTRAKNTNSIYVKTEKRRRWNRDVFVQNHSLLAHLLGRKSKTSKSIQIETAKDVFSIERTGSVLALSGLHCCICDTHSVRPACPQTNSRLYVYTPDIWIHLRRNTPIHLYSRQPGLTRLVPGFTPTVLPCFPVFPGSTRVLPQKALGFQVYFFSPEFSPLWARPVASPRVLQLAPARALSPCCPGRCTPKLRSAGRGRRGQSTARTQRMGRMARRGAAGTR